MQAVRVTVERNAKLCTALLNGPDQRLRMSRTDLVVDIQSVRCATNGHHFCTQLVKHHGRNVVGSAMRCVDHDLYTTQAQVMSKCALAEFNITPSRVIESAGLAQTGRVGPDWRLLQCRLNVGLPNIRQFGPLRAEKLDSVIGKWIVAGADDHAE